MSRMYVCMACGEPMIAMVNQQDAHFHRLACRDEGCNLYDLTQMIPEGDEVLGEPYPVPERVGKIPQGVVE